MAKVTMEDLKAKMAERDPAADDIANVSPHQWIARGPANMSPAVFAEICKVYPDLANGAKLPTRCRVKLNEKMFLPIVGSGASAFDAQFDWDRLVAYGVVEGHLIAVGLNMGVFAFYRN